MINMLILILFFAINILLFFVENTIILLTTFFIELEILLYLRLNFRKCYSFLVKNMAFIIFIFVCNLLYSDIVSSFFVSFKLFLALNLTFIVSNLLLPCDFSEGFYYLFYPLKWVGVNAKNLSFIIAIALAFIPILSDEARNIKKALLTKGFDFNFKNIMTRPHIYLITYLNGLFDRIDELEKSLLMKGYQG